MRNHWSRVRRGLSNITEYVILVSVVTGAAIALQPYVKGRLQGAAKSASDNYDNAVSSVPGLAAGSWEPPRTVNSDASTTMTMSSSKSGTVKVNVDSKVGQTK